MMMKRRSKKNVDINAFKMTSERKKTTKRFSFIFIVLSEISAFHHHGNKIEILTSLHS